MITTQTELDVSPGGISPVIHVSQYDTGSRTLLFNLIATAGDLILPGGTKAEIRGTKPDGNGFSYTCQISGKTVTADVTEQMTAAAGKAVCEIVLYTGTPAREGADASADFMQLATANFILFVERAALDKDTLKSGSEIRQLVNVIDRTDELLAAAATMDEARESIRQMTEDTRSDMHALAQQVETNAEDLAEQSAASARAAELSAQAAERTLETVEAKGQQLSQLAINSDTIAKEALEKATNAENESYEVSNFLETVRRELSQLSLSMQEKIDDAYVEDGFLYMTSEGEVVVGPLGPFSGTGGGGGGGTSGNNAHITLTNKSGFLSRTIAQGDSCPVTINWTSEEDEIPTGNGTMKVTVSGVVKAMIDIKQGDVVVDIGPYVSAGTSVVKINVSDIYGNSRTLNFSITVADVGDLSGLMVGYADFSKAVKLQTLKIGDSDPEYSNGNLTELYLGNNELLRTLDVRNCPNLTQSVDLSGCANIEHVYFDGTAITGVDLPKGGILKTLHLPGTLANLSIIGHPGITDFVLPGKDNLSTCRLENVAGIDIKALLNSLPVGCRVRMIGFDFSVSSDSELTTLKTKLDTMLFERVISFTIRL